MEHLITAMLLVVAAIHLLPLPGLRGGKALAALYGVPVDEPNLAILMRHRAVLFGLLGAFIAVAAFRPELQPMAFVGGYVSVLSFLALAFRIGGYNARIRRVVLADLAALACLVVGSIARLLAP